MLDLFGNHIIGFSHEAAHMHTESCCKLLELEKHAIELTRCAVISAINTYPCIKDVIGGNTYGKPLQS